MSFRPLLSDADEAAMAHVKDHHLGELHAAAVLHSHRVVRIGGGEAAMEK